MKRSLRKILIITGSVILGIVLLLATLPFLFEDELKQALKDGINQQVAAIVDFKDLELSFLRDFPDATISLIDYSVANLAPFEGDTLASGAKIDLTVDLMSIFKGEEYTVRSVDLAQPNIYVHVLPDGRANYDIALPSQPEATVEDTASSTFRLSLQSYLLEEGTLIYHDESLPMVARLEELQHEGNGNFTDTDFLLRTSTIIGQTTLNYDGISYLSKLPLEAEADLNIHNGDQLEVNMLDNRFLLNQFPLEVAGSVVLAEDDIDMDLDFSSPGSNFQTLLSLIPELFYTDLAGFQANGDLGFHGSLTGTYNESSFPGYQLALEVHEASIQYPDLPESIHGIDLNLKIDNPDGRDESLVLDLQSFTAMLGTHPLSATLYLENLIQPFLKGTASASIDLADLASVYPIEGVALAGLFALNAEAEGHYNEEQGTFPSLKANMALRDGFVQSEEYNTRLTAFTFEGTAEDASARLEDITIRIPTFSFLLDNVPMKGSLSLSNLEDPYYEARVSGELDLRKLMQLYPIDSMELAGKLTVNDLYASGNYSDIEAERYDRLTNTGSIEIQSLYYRDLWYTEPGVSLDQGTIQFTPSRLSFQDLSGKLGQSPFRGSGYLSNYLAYMLMGSDELQGNITMSSPSLDLNEWLAEESDSESPSDNQEAGEEALEIYPVPAGYDLVLSLDLDKVFYDDLTLEQVRGLAEVKDRQLLMEDVGFGMLGSTVKMGGVYDTRDPDRAGYDFFLDIDQLAVRQAFEHFSIVQRYAPVAKAMNGICNLELGLKGGLNSDFSPILEDLNAFGLFELIEGGLSGTPLTNTLAASTRINQLSTWSLRDVKGMFNIEDGTLTFDPFDLRLGDMTLTLGGAHNLAGNIRYDVSIDAPAGVVGSAAIQSLGQLTGGALNPGESVQVNLLVTGTTLEPKVSGAGGGTGDQLKNQATAALEQELSEQSGVDVSLNRDTLEARANQARQQAEDSLRTLGQQARQQAQDSIAVLADSAKTQAQQALEEELREHAGEEVTEKLKELKNRIRLPRRRNP